jgi:hypothetical protein
MSFLFAVSTCLRWYPMSMHPGVSRAAMIWPPGQVRSTPSRSTTPLLRGASRLYDNRIWNKNNRKKKNTKYGKDFEYLTAGFRTTHRSWGSFMSFVLICPANKHHMARGIYPPDLYCGNDVDLYSGCFRFESHLIIGYSV